MNELYHYGVKGMRWGVITQEPYEYNPREKKIDIVKRQTQAKSSSGTSSSAARTITVQKKAQTQQVILQAQAQSQTRAKVSAGSSAGKAFVKSSKAMNTPVSQLQKSQQQQSNYDSERAQYEAERERAQYEAEQEAMIEMMIKTRKAAGMPMTDEEIQRMRAEGVSMRVDQGNYGTTTYDRRNRRRG